MGGGGRGGSVENLCILISDFSSVSYLNWTWLQANASCARIATGQTLSVLNLLDCIRTLILKWSMSVLAKMTSYDKNALIVKVFKACLISLAQKNEQLLLDEPDRLVAAAAAQFCGEAGKNKQERMQIKCFNISIKTQMKWPFFPDAQSHPWFKKKTKTKQKQKTWHEAFSDCK